jgi:sugar phosphate isomerase/epimerase
MRYDRRQFAGLLAAAVALPSLPAHALTVRGVELGLQTYTFHQVHDGGLAAVDTMTAGMKQLDVTLCELWAPLIEPFPMPPSYWRNWVPGADPKAAPPQRPSPEAAAERRGKLRAWRINPPADYFPSIKRKFHDAGIRVFAYNYSFEPTMSDGEIDAGFLHAKSLGLDLITASSRVSDAKRVVPFAAKYNMRVAFHGHSAKGDPDQIAGPDSFAAVLAMSPLYRVNLDVAHYAAAGFDAVAYLKQHHDVITNIHVHDRKAQDGASVPFGEGVAPTREVLTMIRDQKWKIPVFYELEYVGSEGRDVIAETARELAYERKILES